MSNFPECKPCPFCGTTPKETVEVTRWEGSNCTISIGVACPTCGIRMNRNYTINGTETDFNKMYGFMTSVVNQWNTRG